MAETMKRFAVLYHAGDMIVFPAGLSFEAAMKYATEDNINETRPAYLTKLVEVELTILKTHDTPMTAAPKAKRGARP